jgi:uncharacterized protein DUF6941
MKVTMLLADAAQAVNGKLYILGGGWSITGPAPSPSAIALKIEVPWDEANTRHKLTLDLVDEDGQPVPAPTPMGMQPIRIEADFEVGRPPGLKPGTPLDVVLALNIGPLSFKPDSRLVWRLAIDGRTNEEWELSFATRSDQPSPRPY